MKPKTELLLYQLLWIGDQLAYPTLRNLSGSFESWAYSAGLLRLIHKLEDEQLLQTQGKSLDRIIKLTKKGHRLISDDRDPVKEWSYKWDGIWRMVLFDIPESKRSLRRELRSVLKLNHFGCFQQSVWLSPRPMDSFNKIIRKTSEGLSNFTLMESRLLRGESNSSVVESTWDFTKINRCYEAYMEHIKYCLRDDHSDYSDNIIAQEKSLWEKAIKQDPLLPKQLLPKNYLGRKAHLLKEKTLPKIINSILKQQALKP